MDLPWWFVKWFPHLNPEIMSYCRKPCLSYVLQAWTEQYKTPHWYSVQSWNTDIFTATQRQRQVQETTDKLLWKTMKQRFWVWSDGKHIQELDEFRCTVHPEIKKKRPQWGFFVSVCLFFSLAQMLLWHTVCEVQEHLDGYTYDLWQLMTTCDYERMIEVANIKKTTH